MPRNHCPPSRRGHTWKELPRVSSESGLTIRDRLELRTCGRCGVLGRISKHGVIHVVEAP